MDDRDSDGSSRAELACRLERLKRIHEDRRQRDALEAQSLYHGTDGESVPFGFEKAEYAAVREARFGVRTLINRPGA